MNRKIDIFVRTDLRGEYRYICSTNFSRSCTDAVKGYFRSLGIEDYRITSAGRGTGNGLDVWAIFPKEG